jgi:hypothetical protein
MRFYAAAIERSAAHDGDDGELADDVDVACDDPVRTGWGGSWSNSPALRDARIVSFILAPGGVGWLISCRRIRSRRQRHVRSLDCLGGFARTAQVVVLSAFVGFDPRLARPCCPCATFI